MNDFTERIPIWKAYPADLQERLRLDEAPASSGSREGVSESNESLTVLDFLRLITTLLVIIAVTLGGFILYFTLTH